MSEGPRPLLIGEFARRCRLPVSTLRYYDRIGLLRPSMVDPDSGYRRYTADQLSAATLVARLRGIGTAPHDIATALLGDAQAAAVLAGEYRRVLGQVADRQRALAELDDLLAQHGAPPPTHDVELVSLVGDQVAAVPFTAAEPDLASTVLRGVAGLRRLLRRAGQERTGPWGAAFPPRLTERVSGFVFARTSHRVDHPTLDTAWLPATRAARTVHHGGPDTIGEAYGAALDLIDRRGWTATGPVIEEYLSLEAGPTAQPAIRLTVPVT